MFRESHKHGKFSNWDLITSLFVQENHAVSEMLMHDKIA